MTLKVFIQNEKNSRIRHKYNEETLESSGKSELPAAAEYQYGFIPGTIGDDGDCEGEHEEDFKLLVCPEYECCSTTVLKSAVSEIKSFTLEIFKKYPDINVTFGCLLPAEDAERFIEMRENMTDRKL